MPLGWLFPSVTAAGQTWRDHHRFAFTSTIPVFDQMWVYAVSIAVSFLTSFFLIITFDPHPGTEGTTRRSGGRHRSAATTATATATATKTEAPTTVVNAGSRRNRRSVRRARVSPACCRPSPKPATPSASKPMTVRCSCTSASTPKMNGEGFAVKVKMSA